MQQEEEKTKKKNLKKIEFLFPGLYKDEQMAIYLVKAAKYKKINYCKLPSSIIDEYDKKIGLFENKLNKQESERQSLIREQSKTPNKAEILNKIIFQIQSHLQDKEKEIFEKQHCDTPVAALNKKKSMFFQAKSHLQLLEAMGNKIQNERVYQKSKFSQNQFYSQPNTPRSTQFRSTSVQNFQNQEQDQVKNNQSDRVQRIQSKVNLQMEKLGLKSISISPDSIQLPFSAKNNKIPNLKKNRTQSQQLISQNSSTQRGIHSSPFKRYKVQVSDDLNQPKDFKSLITYCNTERLDLKKLNKDIKKKRRVQFRKFQVIQKELSTVGELGFDGLKNRYFIQ